MLEQKPKYKKCSKYKNKKKTNIDEEEKSNIR